MLDTAICFYFQHFMFYMTRIIKYSHTLDTAICFYYQHLKDILTAFLLYKYVT